MNRLPLDQVKNSVELAANWLLWSGIQNIDFQDELKGGVNAWYDCARRCYSFTYSEITGYFITAMTYLNVHSRNPLFLSRARLAADWLIEQAFDQRAGYFRYKYDLKNRSFAHRTYAFDEAMILNGLVNLHRATTDKRYLEVADDGARRLLRNWQCPDGTFVPFRSLDNDECAQYSHTWSLQPGSFMAKHAVGLLNLYEVTCNGSIRESAAMICDRVLQYQNEAGAFVTSTYDGSTHLHPHLYTGEGLWVAGKLLGREQYLKAAARATKWALDNQLPNGGIPRIFNGGSVNSCERTDITAQAIRLGLIMISEGLLHEDYLCKIEHALSHLLSFQCNEGHQQEKGGFLFGFQSNGLAADHVNSWCTMFALQAMLLFVQYHQGQLYRDFDCRLLI